MQNKIFLVDIIHFLGGDILDVYGNPEGIEIRHLSDPQNVDEFTLDWINLIRSDKQNIATKSKSRALISDSGVIYDEQLKAQNKVLIIVDNPKLAIAKIGNNFFINKKRPSIHPSAIIHPKARIGKEVYVGPNACIGDSIIGDYVQIHENAVVGDGVTVKNAAIINAAVHVGVDGLGCQRNPDGTLVKFPHFGGVMIEENVELGAQTVVARGVFSDTIIGKGSKINVDCFIAHNVRIGKNVWISPKTNIAGSVKLGSNTTIFSGVIIRDQVVIGNSVKIGMGAVVTKNIPDNETWIGNPARKLEKYDESDN